MHLHDSYVLYTSQDAYTLVGHSDKAETLTISRGANSFSIKRAGTLLSFALLSKVVLGYRNALEY
jgi:hypothetical protein